MTSKQMTKQELLNKLQNKIASVNVGGGNFWKPSDEVSRIRILPGVGDMGFFFQEVGQHYSLPGDKIAFCPHFTSEGKYPCPICETCYELQGGSAGEQDLASKMWLRKRYWMNVIVRKPDDTVAATADGPFVWNNAGPMIFTQIKSLVLNPEYGDISDPDGGIDLIINKEGTGIKTQYAVMTARRDTPLINNEATLVDILKKASDLSPVNMTGNSETDAEISKGKVVRLFPYDTMVNMLLSEVSEESVEQKQEAEPTEVKEQDGTNDTKSDIAETIQARIAARRRRAS